MNFLNRRSLGICCTTLLILSVAACGAPVTPTPTTAPAAATTEATELATTEAVATEAATAAVTTAATIPATTSATMAPTAAASAEVTMNATAASGSAATMAATMSITMSATMAPTMAASAAALAATSAATGAASGNMLVGFILVGPKLDNGWSEAHFHATEYLVSKVPGIEPRIFEKLNPADNPNVTLDQVVQNMKSDGVKLIFTTSDDFEVDTLAAAKKYSDITFINVSGDDVLKGDAPSNLGNVMGRMEYMKMVAGCAAALVTQTKSIGYLGPLINPETRRLASSAYLGAKYCYKTYRKGDPSELKFEVKWIGFWFNIPGTTQDPTAVANSFYDGGADVVLSGIDTPEAIIVAKQRSDKGEKIFAIPYDYKDACQRGPKVCLGVPYFNWGPAYVRIVTAFKNGTWKQSWDWDGPDWKDINNADTSAVGFVYGDALSSDQKSTLDGFIQDMGSGKVNLFTGPLNYQSGKVFLKDGEVATDKQIWYMEELLEGMKGDSQPKS